VAVALDASGNATPALLKKLAALGQDASVVQMLKRAMDGKAEVLFLDSVVPGATLADGLQIAIEAALAALPIPKVMSYQLQDGWNSVKFVRPAHRLVALHGADVVPVSVLGLQAGRETLGHRFEAAHPVVSIKRCRQLCAADGDGRRRDRRLRSAPRRDREAAQGRRSQGRAEAHRGRGAARRSDGAGRTAERADLPFEQEFLDVPQECLILTMKANQKYFPLLDAAGKLTHKFLVVSNIRPADPSAVIGGNERVVRPRLADAKFFFDQDRKKSLMDRIPGLAKVVYHNKLGTQGERVERVAALAAPSASSWAARPWRTRPTAPRCCRRPTC
jgi:glycyl-tRNA synthetase beta chain